MPLTRVSRLVLALCLAACDDDAKPHTGSDETGGASGTDGSAGAASEEPDPRCDAWPSVTQVCDNRAVNDYYLVTCSSHGAPEVERCLCPCDDQERRCLQPSTTGECL